MHVLIDASNTTAAGPRTLVSDLLPSLIRGMDGWMATVLLPDEQIFRDLPIGSRTSTIFLRTAPAKLNDLYRLKRLYWDISLIVQKTSPDVVLTLGDLGALRLNCPQIIFLHNAHFVYPSREIEGFTWPLIKRIYMVQHFKWILRSAKRVIVQTPIMAKRLSERYSFAPEQIVQIAQAIPKHVAAGLGSQTGFAPIQDCHKEVRLLFLSAYYSHKNHAILPLVGKELHRRGMSSEVHIFTTLGGEGSGLRSLQREIELYSDVITNLGNLPSSQVGNALHSSSALFLPSVIESYGNIYLEAMACGVPILTSDRDFARWMCGDLAFYFDPFDAVSIVDSISSFRNSVRLDYRQKAMERLASYPKNWDEVANSFIEVLRDCVMN